MYRKVVLKNGKVELDEVLAKLVSSGKDGWYLYVSKNYDQNRSMALVGGVWLYDHYISMNYIRSMAVVCWLSCDHYFSMNLGK